MANVKTDSRHYRDIADAIRAKGVSGSFMPSQMAAAVSDIPVSSDTTLTDCVLITARDANGYATKVDFYGTTIPKYCFGNSYNNTLDYSWRRLMEVNCINSITALGDGAFSRTNIVAIPDSILENCHTFSGRKTFSMCSSITGECEFKELQTWAGGDSGHFSSCSGITKLALPKLTSALGQSDLANMTGLTEFWAPLTRGATDFGSRPPFYGDSALKSIELGSVGHGITVLSSTTFASLTQQGLKITLYCTGTNMDTFLTNARNCAQKATIVVKASEETTCNGSVYHAGETMITSNVEV